jgi:hypothetical protein
VDGTKGVLEAAAKEESVKAVVMTSTYGGCGVGGVGSPPASPPWRCTYDLWTLPFHYLWTLLQPSHLGHVFTTALWTDLVPMWILLLPMWILLLLMWMDSSSAHPSLGLNHHPISDLADPQAPSGTTGPTHTPKTAESSPKRIGTPTPWKSSTRLAEAESIRE